MTPDMAAFLRIIENRRCLLPAEGQDDFAEFAACAGVDVKHTLRYIAELHPQYLEKCQDHYVLTLKARAFLVDNNLDW